MKKNKMSLTTELDLTREGTAEMTRWCILIALHQSFGIGAARLNKILARAEKLGQESLNVAMTVNDRGMPSTDRSLALRRSWMPKNVDPDFRVPVLRSPRTRREEQLRMAGDVAAGMVWTLCAKACINDNYDNANAESNDSDNIVVPFKNLLNDSYCRDISIKVRSQLDMKRRKGEFIGGYAIYGYCKDERNKNRLVVDEYAADIVRSIYRRKLEGMSAQAIAEQLNSENVLAPSEYKRLCGLNYHSGFKAGTHAKWQAIQVLRILKNEVYTGTMVQGRRQKINYKIKKIRDVEESGWIRVPNMHEAIIPQKLFDTVQEVLKLDTCASKGQQTVNLFSGIVRCGGCGQNMVRRTVSKNGKKYIYLHCVTNHNGLGCSSHLISESKLEEVVLAALQGKVQQISGLEHRLDEINEIPKNERRLKSVEEHLKMLEQEEQKYQTLRRQLYEDMSSGIVSKEEYKEFSHSFNEKVEAIRKAKAEMNRQRDCLNNLDVEHLPWIEDFKSYQNLTSLNRRVLVELVESITVYDKEHIHIQYRFDQEIRNVLEYCSSVPAAETEESAV